MGRRDDRQEQGPNVENFRLRCHEVSSESPWFTSYETVDLKKSRRHSSQKSASVEQRPNSNPVPPEEKAGHAGEVVARQY